MNQDEFIAKVKEKHQKRSNDHLLIDCMNTITEYYKNLSSRISGIDGKLAVGFDHNTADYISVVLFENHLRIKRLDDCITISFVSEKDNEYTTKYNHLELDKIVVKNGSLLSETSGTDFSVDLLDNYLKYLLA